MTYYSEVTTDAPRYWHKFDNSVASEGATATGTITASGVSYAAAPHGTAASVAANGQIGYPMSTNPFNGQWTIESWFKIQTADLYNNVARASGGSQHVGLRVRGSGHTADARPNTIECFTYDGTAWGAVSPTTLNVNDNKWHHVVVKAEGTGTTKALVMFVDGVKYTTTAGDPAATKAIAGVNVLNVGSATTTGEEWDGLLDDVQVYNTALSDARIATHYTSGLPVNVTYVASAMTSTATMPGGKPVLDRTYVASAMTATANMPNSTLSGSIARTPTVDYNFDQNGSTNGAGPTVLYIYDSNDNTTADGTAVIRFDDVPVGVNRQTATLRLITDAAGSGQFRMYPITAPFAPATPTAKSSFTLGAGQVFTPNGTVGAVNNFDVKTMIGQGPIYGFLLEPVATNTLTRFRSMDYTGGASGPILNVAYSYETLNVSYSANAMTATAASPDATISLDTDVTFVAAPMTASATWVAPQVVVDKDMTFVAEAMSASAEFPGGLFSKSIVVAAEPFTASSTMPSSTVTTTLGVVYKAAPMTASARFVTVSAVNDNPIESDGADDRYFQRVNALKPTKWARMTDVGRILTDKVANVPLADIGGLVQTGLHNGPESRANLTFNGSGVITQREPSGTNQDEYITYPHSLSDGNIPHSFEFSFRTDRANEFILGGSDGSMDIGTGVASPGNSFTELVLIDGKLGVNQYSVNSQGGVSTVNRSEVARGFRNIADNEWHHVVARNYRSALTGENGFEIWIDGTLEYRRLVRGIITFAWPDYVGYRPTNPQGMYAVNGVLPALPDTQIFHGDFSEMVYYNFQLSKDDIERNRYAFMGWIPFEAPAMEASATMPNAKAKGNQKKALYLYWSGNDEVFGGMPGKAGQNLEDSISFDPMPNLVNDSYASSLAPRLSEETGEFFGFKVFTKSITRNYSPFGVIAYRDKVTDEQSLIDLETDIDLTDYDVIMFKDWPDEGYERDYYEAQYPGQIERVLGQLRDANDTGIGLYVTNPRLAVDLGIVDRVEFVEPLTEHKFSSGQGRAEGLYDYGSAVKFPWDITSSDGLTGNAFAAGIGGEMNTSPSYLAQKAYFYFDNNRNNKFRVVAKVDGLTNLPSYMLQDAVFHVDADPYGWEGAAYKYLHRENGLEIGDEYIFNGAPTIDGRYLDIVEQRYTRGNGTWATPAGSVKAGTVVTTFGSEQYVGTTKTTNPYQNYATTIVVESGTVLQGRTTKGRIYVNFTETPSHGLGLPVQVLPGSPDSLDNPLGVDVEDLDDSPVFTSNGTGTAQQQAYVNEAMERCTFPLSKLKSRILKRFGRSTIPVVWQDIDPNTSSITQGIVPNDTGTIIIDEQQCIDNAISIGLTAHENIIMTLIHMFGVVVDQVYLQPYQRVNIWNVFHGDWNVYHEDPVSHNNILAAEYLLPIGYPLDYNAKDVHNKEDWSGLKGVGAAFAQAFVKIYSDIAGDSLSYSPHITPDFLVPRLKAAIEVGPGAALFGNSAVDSEWPPGYTPETPAQREWEYSWTRTSLTFSAAALKTRTVGVTLPDGSVQSIVQGSTVATRDDIPLSMVRSGQLFPVVDKPRLEMDARGIYWLADAPKATAGDAVVRATPMEANATAPSATVIAERSTTYIAQSMTATAMSPESAQAKSGNALYLANAMTADAKMSQGNEVTFKAEPMTATATMPDSVYKSTGERITLRIPRPARITLKIKEAV